MKRRLAPPPRKPGEPTIALINIVFLMLVFFLIAGSIAPRSDTDVELVSLEGIDTEPPADALVMLADGTLRLNGAEVEPEAAATRLADEARVRLLPDRETPAAQLIAVAQALRAAGAASLVIVTREGLP